MPMIQNPQVGNSQHTITLNYYPTTGRWTMDDGNGAKGPSSYPRIVVPYNHKGEIVFKIKDTGGAKVEFANPAFVRKTNKPDPGDFPAQFTSTVSGGGKILTVTDANSSANGQPHQTDYHYELLFTGARPLDPIITNMGCCQVARDNYLLPLAIGGAALLAIYFFVVRPWLARKSVQAKPPASRDHMDH